MTQTKPRITNTTYYKQMKKERLQDALSIAGAFALVYFIFLGAMFSLPFLVIL